MVTVTCTSSAAPAPSITGNPSNSTISVGANSSFTVSASNATTYKWQVSTNGGGSFADISNGGVYSGATAATLNITAATIGMTGYQYRAVASGSTSPDATSNAATLTVNKATPAVSVSASDSNPEPGASVTFTATLTGGSSPSGTVTFKDGATTLGTGTVSGTTASFATSALTVGSHSVTAVYEGDTNNATATSTDITVTVAAPTITVSPTTLPTPSVGVSYNPVTFSANGGTEPYTFAVTGGSLPAGMNLSSSGVLSGTPTAGGAFPPITVTATDDNGHTGTRVYTLSVAAPTISISPASLPAGTVGTAYPTQTMSVTGGTAPYTFVFSGILPDGMTFDTGTGEIAGTPTTQSNYTFTVKVTDSSTGTGPYSAQTSVNIDIDMPAIVLLPADGTTLTAGQVGVPYSNTSISATGGSGTMFYEAYDLPPGLTIVEETGEISGTPTEAGSFEWVTVRAGTDMGGLAEAMYVIEIAKAAPTVAVTASDNNPGLGASVTFTATLSGGTSPTGDVEFFDGSTSLGTGTLSGTTATLSTSGLTVGSHTITAKYLGDSNNAVATSTGMTVTVGQSAPTISVSASDNNPALGASVTFTATLSGGTSPTGDVEFFDGSTSLGTGTLSGTTATLSTSGLTVGSHTITAKYLGDSNNAVATSTGITVTVGQSAPTISVSASDNNPALGASVTFTATLSGGTSPTGDVEFFDGSTSLGTGTLSGTTATLSTSGLTVGSHTITAKYLGDSNNAVATSTGMTVTVGQSAPTISVSASDNNPALGASVTFTATLSGGTSPTGDVEFFDGSTSLGTGTLSGTTATLSTSGLTVGSHTITAKYLGDSNNAVATSTGITVTVTAAPVTFTFAPAAGALTDGTVDAAYSKTVTATGGTGTVTYSVSGTLPKGLSLNPSTGEISGTPTTAGDYSFTIVATDSATPTANTGSAAYTLKVDPAAVTLTFSPSAGTLTDGTVGTAYSKTVTASGGTGTVTYSVSGTLPKGLSLNPSTGEISGTPATAGDYSFTIVASDSATPTANTGSAAYTLKVDPAAVTLTFSPSAGSLTDGTVGTAYSKTVTASGGTGTVTYSVSGTLPAGLSLNPSTGEISGTPATAGDYSFAIVATDSATPTANTGSAAYTLKVDPAAVTLTFSPSAGTLTDGTVGTAYSKTVTASGGTAPYSHSVTSGALPAGLSLTASTGKITGTPTASGSFSFTVTATDATGATGTVAYTLKVKRAAVIFVFSPASGSTLAEAMVGEAYSQSISAKGGTGTLIYSLASGELPEGMVLNVSTGELTGPLDTNAEDKDYAFTIRVRDGNGSTGTASYTLTVKPREVTVTDKVVNVEAGATPADVYLNRGATGGPFVSADMTFVEPSNAGTSTIIQGELAAAGPVTTPVGWYLQFTPNPTYSGQVRVGFRLTSALGISNTGTITYNIAVDAAKVAAEIDTLVHGFVQSRQNMIANTIKVPGLLERRQMGEATDPVTARMTPSESGTTADFSTSLAQMESARDSADGVPGGYASPFNIWIDGAFLAHNDKDINGGKWGTFALINAGADYLLSDKALLGLSVHYDRMTDPTDEDAELTGNGWMAGPYASFEIGKGVFWNASLRYGGSSNDIDTAFWDGTFDTTRWMADTSVEGQWMLRNDTSITPKLRVLYFSETVEDYEVKNSAGDTIGIDGFDEEQFRVSLGAEIARSFTLESGSKLTPKLGVTGGFSGLDGAGAFGTVTAGLSLQAVDMWMLDASLLLNLDGDGGRSVGGRVKAVKTF